MKKTILFVVSFVLCSTTYAQLIVNNAGKVSVATEDEALSKLSIGGAGNNSTDVYVHQKKSYGLNVTNNIDSCSSPVSGVNIKLNSNRWYSSGLYSETVGNGSNHVRGVEGKTYGGRYNVGVWGGVEASDAMISGAGIFGATTNYPIMFDGLYAGYFHGNVKVIGSLHATYLTNASSSSVSPTYAMLHEEDGASVVEKLSDIELLQINRDEFPDYQTEEKKIPGMTKHNEIRYGLAVDQLEKVFPELVYKDENGNVSINYVEMVPLLVKSINELQQRIKVLEGGGKKEIKRNEVLVTNIDGQGDELSLSQNNPNPFHESTNISLKIPSTTQNAILGIYDLTGKQMRKFQIKDRGEVRVTITADGLNPGMYIYAIVADGQMVSSKRMILE